MRITYGNEEEGFTKITGNAFVISLSFTYFYGSFMFNVFRLERIPEQA